MVLEHAEPLGGGIRQAAVRKAGGFDPELLVRALERRVLGPRLVRQLDLGLTYGAWCWAAAPA
jgi:hypothetical protein